MSNASNKAEKKMYKFAVSIAFGLLGFCLNFYPLDVIIPPHKASFVWGLIFPMLVSLSWGWKYGLVASTLGLGAQTMWFLWLPLNGWAPFVSIILYNLWIVWHGWCAEKKKKGLLSSFYGAEIPFRIFSTIIHLTVFPWVFRFNPSPWAPQMTMTSAPSSFVLFIVFKLVVEGLIVLFLADVLMNFRIVKKILLIKEKIDTKASYIISGALLFGFLYWIISGVSNYLFFSQDEIYYNSYSNSTLADTLILNVPPHEFFSRISLIFICLIAGLLISKYFSQYRESEVEKEEAFKIINKSNSVAFLWENTEGWPVEFVTQNVQKLFGYSTEDFVSGNISYLSIIHPEDQKRISDEVAFFSEKKGCQDFEHEPYRIITKDNEVKWVSDSTYPRRDDQGKITHYQGVVEDITKRKQAEDLLSEEKERLAVTLRSIGDGVITTDTGGNIVLINKIAEKLTGWSQEEACSKPFSEVFHIINERTRKSCENPVEKVLSSGKIIGRANYTALIAKDGTERSIAESGAPIRDKESQIIGVVLVFRDVTETNKMEEELLKVKKLESVGVLAGGIAHDFNNILAAILGNIDLALLDDNLGIDTRKLLTEAEKASVRAKDLTQQLLTFSKGGEPVKETTSLPEIIKDSAEFVLHGSNVACQYHIPDDLWLVDIDKGQMSQVIQNLIINAKHAMPTGGTIKITCDNIHSNVDENIFLHRKDNFVRIALHDSGIGIPENVIDKIFDPFFSTKQEGSGLGLAISHSIISKHEGHISIQSQPGEGTTFTIYLPALVQKQQKAKRKETVDSGTGKAKIMVMDDEEIVRIVTKGILTKLGHDVVLVQDGAEALKVYKEHSNTDNPIDIVLMDLTIPGGIGGKDAVKNILAIDPDAKVIVSSGYSNDPIMANCQEYGFVAAVIKPYTLQELGTVVGQVLQ